MQAQEYQTSLPPATSPNRKKHRLTKTPVLYDKGARQIVIGKSDSHQHVACLLWTEQLAELTARASLLKARVGRAKAEYCQWVRNL